MKSSNEKLSETYTRTTAKKPGRGSNNSKQDDERPLTGARRMRFANSGDDVAANSKMPNIEGLNRQIVELLQEDSRAAYSSVAKKLNVSEATVRTRVARMRKSNLIHFITAINPIALGYTAWAMLGIKVASGVSVDQVAKYFRDRPEVVYVMRVASRFDLLAEIVCETPDDLREFMDSHCYGQKDVGSVEPMIGLGLYKSLFKWEKALVAGNGTK